MKTFSLKIDMENAAFEEHPSQEVRRILLKLVDHLVTYGDGSTEGHLYDVNGNRVGSWQLELEPARGR